MVGSIAPAPAAPSKKPAQKAKGPGRAASAPSAAAPAATAKGSALSDADKAALAAKRRAAAEKRRSQLANHDRDASSALRIGTYAPPKPAPVPVADTTPNAAARKALTQKAALATQDHSARAPAHADAVAAFRGFSQPKSTVSYTAAGQRVMTHSAAAQRLSANQARGSSPAPLQQARKASAAGARSPAGKFPGQKKRSGSNSSSGGAVKLAYEDSSRASSVDDSVLADLPPGMKQCRRCSKAKPLGEFFVDKRNEGGFMHQCAPCARFKGLSGRFASEAELRESTAGAAAPAQAQVRKPTGAAAARPSPLQPPQQRMAWYAAGAARGATGALAPAVAAVRGGEPAKRARARQDLDAYEDDFVEDDVGDEDWRKELQQVTRAFYREDRGDAAFDDRAMEASAAELRREEARSRRIGRQEDLAAEREELARVAAKEAKLARARARQKAKRRKTGRPAERRAGGAMFLDDGGDEEDDDSELELSE